MSDEWDESSEYTAASYTSPSYNDNGGDDGGKSFGGSGRGFSAFETDNDSNGYQGGRGGGRSRGDGRGRGRGGRGGGRGGGGRGGRDGDRGGRDGEWGGGSNNYDNNEDSNGYNNDGGERRGGFRGGRGGRGGREGGGGDREGNENGEPEKKREQYIPPEPTDDENEMFGSAITSGINFKKYDSIEVNVTGENAPPKIRDFESAGFRPLVLENIKKSGYNVPTPIQKAAIPIIMAERDLMGCAQTGSGKTAAFLLPIINNLLSDPMDIVVEGGCAQPQVVIISPTRELAIQIHSEARKFAHQSILKICIAYGGTVSRHQGDAISRGCHILVATPGRLFDLLERRRLNFASVKFVVLDEADRMLDMGFIKDVEKMMNHPTMTPKEERRTLMFSATFPEEIQRLAHQFLTNFLFVSVGIVGGACSDVEQTFYEVGKYKKREKLVELLQENGDERCMVFVSTKRNADFLAICLSQMNISTTSIHGDRLQSEREMALADFKRGKCPVLVATAVASRGLDIKNVSHVINYDMPTSIDEYVHRIGRTGRVGNKGKASSFFDSSSDNAIAGDLVKILKQAGQNVPDFLEAAGSGGGSYSQNAFGGEDIRSFSTNPGMSVPEEEESW